MSLINQTLVLSCNKSSLPPCDIKFDIVRFYGEGEDGGPHLTICNEPHSPTDGGSKFHIDLSPTAAEALRDFLIYALTRS